MILHAQSPVFYFLQNGEILAPEANPVGADVEVVAARDRRRRHHPTASNPPYTHSLRLKLSSDSGTSIVYYCCNSQLKIRL